MKNFFPALAIVLLGLVSFPVIAQQHQGGKDVSKYAGQEKRAIKGLSPGDIAELRRGGGWGLAKAAELNGVPGPAHLLEMKTEIALDAAQLAAIEALYRDMKSAAIRHGERLIGLEKELERHFQEGTIDDAILRETLARIAETRRELRYIHLATHLKTPNILTPQQIKKYNALRGYAPKIPAPASPRATM